MKFFEMLTFDNGIYIVKDKITSIEYKKCTLPSPAPYACTIRYGSGTTSRYYDTFQEAKEEALRILKELK